MYIYSHTCIFLYMYVYMFKEEEILYIIKKEENIFFPLEIEKHNFRVSVTLSCTNSESPVMR